MAWTVTPAGSWSVAATDDPSVMAAALALPQSWPIGQQPELFVRADQVSSLPLPGPPVAGYVAWWDAAQISGVADGAALAAWPAAAGGSSWDLAQATPANRPVYYKTTAGQLVNGKPAAQFNGTSHWMAASGPAAISQPLSVVAVCTDPTGDTAFRVVFDSNTGAEVVDYADSGTWNAQAGTNLAGPAFTGTAFFVAAVFNGASSSNTVNAATATGATGSHALTPLTVGAALGHTSGWWKGAICELMVYPSALTAPQIASLRAYAQSKWGTP
jgi:hypothetical protein